MDAKAARCDLLDHAIGIVAIFIGFEARCIFAALARHRLRTDPVHRDRQRLMRFRRERTKRHARRHETLADFRGGLHLVDRHGFAREIKLHQVTQIDRRQIAHPARELQIGRIAVGRDRRLQQVHQLRGIGMRLPTVALAIKAADRQPHDRCVICLLMAQDRAIVERGIAFARNLRRHAGEQIIDQSARQADRFEIIAAAIAADDRNAHFGHDLEQAFVDRDAIALETGV